MKNCVILRGTQEGCPRWRTEIIPYELDAVSTAERNL